MSKQTTTTVMILCDLCGRNISDAYESAMMTELRVYPHTCGLGPPAKTVHVCSTCKRHLLTHWNARCS